MQRKPYGTPPDIGQTLRSIDQKLPLLTRDQQNLVASYAQGLADGMALRREGARPTPSPTSGVREGKPDG